MRFAVDACVPAQLAEALKALGADVASAAGRPAMPDDEVLRGALARDRVLITTDKGFGELVFRDGRSAVGVVLIRFDIVTTAAVEQTADLGAGQRRPRLVRGARNKRPAHSADACLIL